VGDRLRLAAERARRLQRRYLWGPDAPFVLSILSPPIEIMSPLKIENHRSLGNFITFTSGYDRISINFATIPLGYSRPRCRPSRRSTKPTSTTRSGNERRNALNLKFKDSTRMKHRRSLGPIPFCSFCSIAEKGAARPSRLSPSRRSMISRTSAKLRLSKTGAALCYGPLPPLQSTHLPCSRDHIAARLPGDPSRQRPDLICGA
jgi:hypothetical protein